MVGLARRCHGIPLSLAVVALGCSEYEVVEKGYADRFMQGGEQVKADVVFLVDNSASMVEEQARLETAFTGFTDVLLDTRADFQLVVTTTDPSDDAPFVGPILTHETRNLEEALLEQLSVGTDGLREEEGFTRALAAIAPGSGFVLRPDARLVVVVFSDEDDASPGAVEAWVDALLRQAPSGELYIHSIVGDLPGGCASGLSAASPGPRYLEGTALTDGLSASICADDYGKLLEEVGFAVSGWNDTFRLNHLPEPATLEVRVDSVLIPERDEDGWRYSLGDNAVLFDGWAIPRPGMSVNVAYQLSEGSRTLDDG